MAPVSAKVKVVSRVAKGPQLFLEFDDQAAWILG